MTNQEQYENIWDKANKYDKLVKALDKVRAELIQSIQNGTLKIESGTDMLFDIIDKYKAESEVEE